MSLATHRTALVALLAAQPNVGNVHPEEPWGKGQAEFEANYLWANPALGGQKEVRGWWLRRTGTIETTLGNGRTQNAHTWRVRGFVQVMPPDSGRRFDDLIEVIRKALRNDPTLGDASAAGPLNNPTGVQVLSSEPVMFGNVLCHATDLRLTTYELLDFGE